jgi:hypothetical protein
MKDMQDMELRSVWFSSCIALVIRDHRSLRPGEEYQKRVTQPTPLTYYIRKSHASTSIPFMAGTHGSFIVICLHLMICPEGRG